jgi:hypothetical protein
MDKDNTDPNTHKDKKLGKITYRPFPFLLNDSVDFSVKKDMDEFQKNRFLREEFARYIMGEEKWNRLSRKHKKLKHYRTSPEMRFPFQPNIEEVSCREFAAYRNKMQKRDYEKEERKRKHQAWIYKICQLQEARKRDLEEQKDQEKLSKLWFQDNPDTPRPPPPKESSTPKKQMGLSTVFSDLWNGINKELKKKNSSSYSKLQGGKKSQKKNKRQNRLIKKSKRY